MLVRLIWECGSKFEKIVNVPGNVSKDYIKKLFLKHFGIEYDENSRWEVLDEE